MTAPITPERVAERLTQMADLMEMLWKDGLRPDEFLLQEWITILRNPAIFAALGPQWIAVSDRLPESNGYYLTAIAPILDKPFVRAQSYIRQEHEAVSGWRYGPVTRWQPLPAAPSDDEVKGGHE